MRFDLVSVLALASVGVCSAGSIEIGQVSSGNNLGLTYAYITGTGGCAPGVASCVTGSVGGTAGSNSTGPGTPTSATTGFEEKNYENILFATAKNGTTPATPFSGYNQTSATTPGSTLGPFAMISDSTNGANSNNVWQALSSSSTITVPIGISNVTDVETMISNLWGLAGVNDTDITFNYGTSSNASSFNDVVTVDLTNAGNSTATAQGQIGTAVDCTTAGSSSCNTTYAVGPLAGSSTPTTTVNSNPATLTVLTGNLASNLFGSTNGNSYNSANGSIFVGTSGNVSLDYQDFLLGAIVAPSSSEYLVSIQVTEEVGGSSSKTSLSAITVNTTATPEPSTIFLFLSGFGALGFSRLRRKKS